MGMPSTISDFYQPIGSKIRTARTAANLTQEELAHAVHLSRAAIANIEKGRQKLLVDKLYVIAAACKVDPRIFLPDPAARALALAAPGIQAELESKIRESLGSKDAQIIIETMNQIKNSQGGNDEHPSRKVKGNGVAKAALQKGAKKDGRPARSEALGR